MIKTCGQCNICTLGSNVFVPSELYIKSKILALAEAPGYHEAQDGRPLVGVAGQDMNRIIEGLGCKREDVNFMNAVSCRPTKIEDGKTFNRTPTDNEIMWCNARLIREIEALSPVVIVCMGKTPYIALGGNKSAMMNQVAGTKFTWRDRFEVIVTYHPAAIAHSGGVTSQRGKMIRDNIEQAFKLAFESKPQNKQLRML
jgi:uracil-DNA glycosylase